MPSFSGAFMMVNTCYMKHAGAHRACYRLQVRVVARDGCRHLHIETLKCSGACMHPVTEVLKYGKPVVSSKQAQRIFWFLHWPAGWWHCEFLIFVCNHNARLCACAQITTIDDHITSTAERSKEGTQQLVKASRSQRAHRNKCLWLWLVAALVVSLIIILAFA
eukprot:165647-Pelagomonas_calceolata.AAC.1